MTRDEEIYNAINNLQIGVYDEDILSDSDEINLLSSDESNLLDSEFENDEEGTDLSDINSEVEPILQ